MARGIGAAPSKILRALGTPLPLFLFFENHLKPGTQEMSFDLFEVPEGYETDLALVIAPYFDPKFAKHLIKRLSPERIRFVIDDGARSEDVAALEKACKGTDVKVALGATRGIVHMKGFYFEFVRSQGRRQRRRRFLFGSANATVAAFSGNINAELFADVDLTLGDDGELLGYLDNILYAINSEDDSNIESAAFGPLNYSPTLYLPSFRISPVGPPPGFDSWLQRGLLVAEYKNAPQFLNVTLKLRNPLPMGRLAEIFAARGLIPIGSRNVVRYPYIGQMPVDEGDDASVTKWKAVYCLWTHLGEWVSDDCYGDLGDTMQAKSSPIRKAKIAELLAHAEDNAWRDKRRQKFINILKGIWDDLDAAYVNPGDYLPSSESGLDESTCRKKFDDKIHTDLLLATDDDFRRRYENGYEFPNLPRFRQDSAAWESFVLSFGESIAVEAMKPSPLSKLTKDVRSAFSEMDLELVEMKATDIIKVLRKSWNKAVFNDEPGLTVGQFVSGYFSR